MKHAEIWDGQECLLFLNKKVAIASILNGSQGTVWGSSWVGTNSHGRWGPFSATLLMSIVGNGFLSFWAPQGKEGLQQEYFAAISLLTWWHVYIPTGLVQITAAPYQAHLWWRRHIYFTKLQGKTVACLAGHFELLISTTCFELLADSKKSCWMLWQWCQ